MVSLTAAHDGWTARLAIACEPNGITPYFQPIIDLARGVVCGYEGLSRFPVAAGAEAARSPQEWFAAANRLGVAGHLEAAALRAMLGSLERLPDNTFLSVNLSPEAVNTPEVSATLAGFPELTGVVFEITEQTEVRDYAALGGALDRLRERGAMIAVDDAGSGYASLRHLLVLRPDFVKLDRSLISGIDGDSARAAAVSAIGAFAGELDAWIVAEGIERREELDRLLELSVPLVQGFLLGRPAPEMGQLPEPMARRLRDREQLRRSSRLAALAQAAVRVEDPPDVVSDITVRVDAQGRPLEVFTSGSGRRMNRYAATCVQPHDGLSAVALRAAGREGDHRYAPLCLCDDFGHLTGVISVASLLEDLARRGVEDHAPG